MGEGRGKWERGGGKKKSDDEKMSCRNKAEMHQRRKNMLADEKCLFLEGVNDFELRRSEVKVGVKMAFWGLKKEQKS